MGAETTTVKSMERQKKRKTLDKERCLHTAEETKPKSSMDVELKATEAPDATVSVSSSASSSGVLPEFHVDMFKDLASADGSVRKAAVEALSTELMEVQRAYEWLENKELVEGGGVKLESEKDDGWDMLCGDSFVVFPRQESFPQKPCRRLQDFMNSLNEILKMGNPDALLLALKIGEKILWQVQDLGNFCQTQQTFF